MHGRTVVGLAALMVLAPVALDAQAVESSYLDLVEWRLVGPTRGGRGLAVAGDPVHDFTFYQGTAGGGVWKTTDGGRTWERILYRDEDTGAIDLVMDPSDPNVRIVSSASSLSVGVHERRSGDGAV